MFVSLRHYVQAREIDFDDVDAQDTEALRARLKDRACASRAQLDAAASSAMDREREEEARLNKTLQTPADEWF